MKEWRRRILRGIGALALAFILASAVMFWRSLIEERQGWGTAGYTDYSHDFYPYVKQSEEWKKLSPQGRRSLLAEILKELREKSNAELYELKNLDDICEQYAIDCRGASGQKVKSIIENVLGQRQSYETYIFSAAGMGIGFLALIFTYLTYRKTGRAKSNDPR